MSEYLSKEEIKQWRSSLEKITLEEFAKRLGKTLKEEKQTRAKPKDNILKIASKSVDMQNDAMKKEDKPKDLFSTLNFTFKKSLTPREKAVLEHFIQNKNEIVYAKDLAKVLELPTDYVYKYIKNLRAKINEDILQNATKGVYRLNMP